MSNAFDPTGNSASRVNVDPAAISTPGLALSGFGGFSGAVPPSTSLRTSAPDAAVSPPGAGVVQPSTTQQPGGQSTLTPPSGFAGANWINPNPVSHGGLTFDDGGDVPQLPSGNGLAAHYPKWNDALDFVDGVLSWGRQKYGIPDASREAGDQEQAVAAGGGIQLPAAGTGQQGAGQQPSPQVMRYLMHADRANPKQVSVLEQGAPAQHPADKAVMAIARAAQADPQAGWSVLQHYLAQYDAYRTFAKAALKRGDLAEATKAATLAHNNLPDGQQTTFQPTQGGIAVTTQGGGGQPDQGNMQAASEEQSVAKGGTVQGYDDGGDVPSYDQPPSGFPGLSGVGDALASGAQTLGMAEQGAFAPPGAFSKAASKPQTKVIDPAAFNALLGTSADAAMDTGSNILVGQAGGQAGGPEVTQTGPLPPASQTAAAAQPGANDYGAQEQAVIAKRKENLGRQFPYVSQSGRKAAALDEILKEEQASASGLQKQKLVNEGWNQRGAEAQRVRGEYENVRWNGRNEKDIQVARIKAAAEVSKLQSQQNIRMAHEAWQPFISAIRSGLIQPDQAMEQLKKAGASPEQIQQTIGQFVAVPTTQAPQVTNTGPSVNAPPRFVRGPGGGWVPAQ